MTATSKYNAQQKKLRKFLCYENNLLTRITKKYLYSEQKQVISRYLKKYTNICN